MTTDPHQEPTPEQVAEIATVQATLPRFALLGVFGSSDAPAALVRENTRTTTRVVPGDTIARHKVVAIGDDHLVLARGGQTKVLRLPAA